MSIRFFSKLSQNYVEILQDNEYYDITIEVGEDPNVKVFRAHMIILCHRSPYLRRALASNKKNSDGVLSPIKLPNIMPANLSNSFKVRYIYGGILTLDEQEISNILKVLVAADELLLHELVDYLQTYLIKSKASWMEQHFELIHRTSFQSNNLLELQTFCIDFMAKFPEKIFKSLDFTSLPEKSLVSILKRDDLQMKEIEVWEHVLKWGFAQNTTLTPDTTNWTNDDTKTMENTLQNCLPLIRFYNLSSKDFLKKVLPYKKLLKHQLYDALLEYYLDFESEPGNNVLSPRNGKIDSKIVNIDIVSLISKCVDKIDIASRFANRRELYLPYEFKLLYRGSRDGLTPNNFHTLCDNKPKTVTFIKVNGTDEILGGYNPLAWKSDGGWGVCINSFIFSFKNKNSDAIISNVENVDKALFCGIQHGVTFSYDLKIHALEQTTNFDNNYCKKSSYGKKIRDTEKKFLIEDYEVFQIIKINKNE